MRCATASVQRFQPLASCSLTYLALMEMTTWCTCPVAGTHPTIIDHEWYYFRLNGPTNFIATGSLRSSRGRGDHTGVGYRRAVAENDSLRTRGSANRPGAWVFIAYSVCTSRSSQGSKGSIQFSRALGKRRLAANMSLLPLVMREIGSQITTECHTRYHGLCSVAQSDGRNEAGV